ncbi:hypothetical protein TPHA_0C03010 [Tetrapisispora phaffii CBS 4417]|uniref:lysine--tRNA ligase n=1 Tax=Tetrapisispora phaffii (strain ATCC 24235 / CBS 4417 / NBRC 1672 / NRRL Y-8282 / UCD 70-5) TaxID=1071381 RepID=G8BRS8_TETPH|nr:hypothetical protein TPHA_0C03010 [Tetrapisispora phaffii CBS 4417]CCE62454.1 hypothetical protein TPHA_0C03010 [Tetrapisispora phaffii CBS 4417]
MLKLSSINRMATLTRFYSLKSKKIILDASNLEFTKRNEIILKNLHKYYPSISRLDNDNSVDAYQKISIKKFNETYSNLDNDNSEVKLSIYGRIKKIRFSGKKICFIDLINNYNKQLQLIVNYNNIQNINNEQEFYEVLHFLKNGDYIQSFGFPGLSQSKFKTLSLKCNRLPIIISPAQLPLPPKLNDHNKIKNNRVIDYQVNGISTIILRSFINKQIRKFLDERDFVEVETPILSRQSNGAIAKPFVTKLSSSIENGKEKLLQLRIAPELWLKRLVVGGIDRVYEIGKVFRNEGIDQTHNPEFTTLEFYQSYASMEDLIKQAEQLFKYIITSLHESEIVKESVRCKEIVDSLYNTLSENDWRFNRIDFLPTLTKEFNNEINFNEIDLNDPTAILDCLPEHVKAELFQGVSQNKLSPQQILNKLCSHFIEKKYCNNLLPTLICNHPTVMSPLSKTDAMKGNVSKRFELFINGTEFINAYEEENCPQLQEQKFLQQKNSSDCYGDEEALPIDNNYIESMKWGMPPIGGLGLGIDRLCMLLLHKTRIEEVLSFGTLSDVNRQ